MKSFLRSRSGYTLVEMMVVVVIMAISAGTLIIFSRLGQNQTTLYIESSKIIDVILRAKSLAISAYRDPSLGNRATCAHGIFLDLSAGANSFSLDRYLKTGVSMTNPVPEPCAKIEEPNPTPMYGRYDRVVAESSTYVLAKGVVFDPTGTTVSDIIFRPPDPQIFFFDSSGFLSPGGSGVIVIMDAQSGEKIRIVVGQGGQITYNFVD